MSEEDDGWNWPWLLYIGRRWFGLTENEFWSKTPRQFYALLKAHKDITALTHGASSNAGSTSSTEAVGYIDTIPGW